MTVFIRLCKARGPAPRLRPFSCNITFNPVKARRPLICLSAPFSLQARLPESSRLFRQLCSDRKPSGTMIKYSNIFYLLIKWYVQQSLQNMRDSYGCFALIGPDPEKHDCLSFAHEETFAIIDDGLLIINGQRAAGKSAKFEKNRYRHQSSLPMKISCGSAARFGALFINRCSSSARRNGWSVNRRQIGLDTKNIPD